MIVLSLLMLLILTSAPCDGIACDHVECGDTGDTRGRILFVNRAAGRERTGVAEDACNVVALAEAFNFLLWRELVRDASSKCPVRQFGVLLSAAGRWLAGQGKIWLRLRSDRGGD
jgi:hypothetical protein